MSKKLKKTLKRIIVSLVLFLIVKVTDIILINLFRDSFENGLASIITNKNFGWILPLVLYLAIYIYIGYDVIKKSIINIKNGQIFDENFLMVIATFGAFGLGIYTGIVEGNPEGFDEACAVLLFYQTGEWFQSYAVGKSRKEIASLMDIRPDYANLVTKTGVVTVDPNDVKINDVIEIRPGEKVPLDGTIISGSSCLDTKALTGESFPQDVVVGSNILSGAINLTGTIKVKVSSEFSNSTVSKILELVEKASSEKSKSENFITKFSKYYTPIVVYLAIFFAFVPPIINGFLGDWSTFSSWIYRALSFLVVSCPCALVISVPLSFFCAIGGASKKGILIKGSIYLENFNKANTFVFDKTGTLTKGNFKVTKVIPSKKADKEEILRLAAIAEGKSKHPIAVSICNAYGKKIDDGYELENIAGKGIKAKGSNVILCGNEKLMESENINFEKIDELGTVVYVVKNNCYLGAIVIEDEIKEEAYDLVNYLNKNNIRTIMLTGDNRKIATSVASKLGINDVKASLLPQDKASELDKLLKDKKQNDLICYVGDGINDAPVLMKSDIGISMGGVGSDAAIEASDIVLMTDKLELIKEAKRIAKKTMKIVKQNIIFAISVKIIILVLTVLSLSTMWLAVFGDVGVAFLAIVNAMRASK